MLKLNNGKILETNPHAYFFETAMDKTIEDARAFKEFAIQEFRIFCQPMPLGRNRSAARIGHNGKAIAWSYMQASDKNYQAGLYYAVSALKPIRILPPYTVFIRYYISRQKGKRTFKSEFPGREFGDLDNLEKSFLDALFKPPKKNGIYYDDCEVINVMKFKRFIGPGERPRIEFVVIGKNG